MRPQSLEYLLGLLKEMAKCEMTIAEFYHTCADIWGEDKEFWLNLEQQEKNHAQNINKMAELISEKHEHFEFHRPFNPIAMKTIISGIEDNINLLKDRRFSKENILFIALNIEQSLIEARYSEIVKTKDLEYRKLVEEVVNQTAEHKGLIENAIAKIKNAE